MKLETSVKDLSAALKKVIPFVGAEKTYENILLDINSNVLTIKTYSNSANAKIRLNVKSDSDFNFVIKGTDFNNIANSFNDFISIEKLDDNFILLSEKKTKIKLNVLNASYFPEKLPNIENAEPIELENAKLINGLIKTYNFVDSKFMQVLNGINFKLENNTLIFAGTDGNRISTCKYNVKIENNIDVILPLNLVKELIKYDYANVNIFISNKLIKFVYDDFEIISNTIEGAYPKYKGIIDLHTKNLDNELKFKKNEVENIIKKIELLDFDKKSFKMNVILENEKMTIEYTNSNNNSLNEDFTVEFNGEQSFAVTYKYFADILKNFKNDVLIKLGSESKNAILFENGNNTMLLMKVK